MRNLLAFLALVSVGALAAGCAQPTLEETVQQFLDKNGIDAPQDCGDVDLDLTCSMTTPKEVQCFLDAFAACKPAQLSFKQSTIEGDPIYSEYIVTPAGAACTVEVFVDSTQDNFGDKKVSSQTCNAPTGDGTCENLLSVDGCVSPCPSGADCG